MSLRTDDINKIIQDCDYYKELIKRPKYLKEWVDRPEFTYNAYKKCRDLEQIKLTSNPIVQTDDVTNVYDYKTLQPRRLYGVREFFSGSQHRYPYNYKKMGLIIIIITVLIYLFYKHIV